MGQGSATAAGGEPSVAPPLMRRGVRQHVVPPTRREEIRIQKHTQELLAKRRFWGIVPAVPSFPWKRGMPVRFLAAAAQVILLTLARGDLRRSGEGRRLPLDIARCNELRFHTQQRHAGSGRDGGPAGELRTPWEAVEPRCGYGQCARPLSREAWQSAQCPDPFCRW